MSAWAAPPDGSVTTSVGGGASIDWTRMELVVTADAVGTEGTWKATEQLARREVDATVQRAVGAIQVTPDARVVDLLADGHVGTAIRARLARWEVTDATYLASGRVELVATLSLQELLRPWAMQIARGGATPEVDPDGPTGVVVDARGTGLEPSYVVRLVGPEGRLLFGGELWEEQAVTVPPFRFLPDGAHPRVLEAGDRPLLLVAGELRGADLVLREVPPELDGALGRSPVLVIVDAP